MKAGRKLINAGKQPEDFVIPLSPLALKALAGLLKGKPTNYVFQGPNGGKMELFARNDTLQELGYKATAHGIRASFKTWRTRR